MPRYCFTLQVDPRHLDAYRRDHAAVWPEMLRALADAGWRNYSLHLRGDGLLTGIVEAEDFQRALAAMDAPAPNDRSAETNDHPAVGATLDAASTGHAATAAHPTDANAGRAAGSYGQGASR